MSQPQLKAENDDLIKCSAEINAKCLNEISFCAIISLLKFPFHCDASRTRAQAKGDNRMQFHNAAVEFYAVCFFFREPLNNVGKNVLLIICTTLLVKSHSNCAGK